MIKIKMKSLMKKYKYIFFKRINNKYNRIFITFKVQNIYTIFFLFIKKSHILNIQ